MVHEPRNGKKNKGGGRKRVEKEGDKRLINLFPSPLSSHFKLSDYVTWVSELQLLQY